LNVSKKEKDSIDEIKSTEQDDEVADRDYFRTKTLINKESKK